MIDNQIDPQRRAQALRDQGVNVDVAFVSVKPDAEGYPVTCAECGRTATLPSPMPAGKVAVCPPCMRRLSL